MKTINHNYVPNIGLAIVLIWVGFMKFTSYEANAISGLIANNPLMSWVYEIFSFRTTSSLIGTTELIVAGLILTQPWKPKLAFLGGLGAIATFLTTLTFLVTTPGVWEPTLGGFPAASVMPGQFLLKDFALLAIAIWITLRAKNSLDSSSSKN